MYFSIFGHMLFACFVFVLAVSTVCAWNSDYYYDESPYFFDSDDYHDPNPLKYPTHQRSQCDCIKLKDCPTFTLRIRAAPKPLSTNLMRDIRKKACGFSNLEPLVCCPSEDILPRNFRQVTTDRPWVWDNSPAKAAPTKPTKPTNLFNRFNENGNDWNQRTTLRPARRPISPNKYSSIRKNKKQHNIFDFEDPRTFRNCPPSFSPDFRIPPHFQHVKPFRNFHPVHVPNNDLDPNAGDSYNSNHVDNDFVFPSQSDLPIQPSADLPIFPSRVAKFSLEKLSLVNKNSCGISIASRIIGGDDADPGQFPWMARLAYRNRTSQLVSYRCSGSVISNKYVLTAAHCVTNLVDDLELVYVRLGELDSRTNLCDNNRNLCSEPQDYEIESVVHHSSYDMPKYANDIALIRLRNVANTSFISPLCLPLGSYETVDQNLTNKTGIVAGWGVSTLGGASANPMLQHLRLPIVDTQSCADSYARFSAFSRSPIIIDDSQICAQGSTNHDACQGDSGGPIMREDRRSGRFVLIGLVSFGPRACGIPSFPGVYSRTSSHLDWILNNMQS